MKPAKVVVAPETVDELAPLVVELMASPGLLQAASNAAGAAYEKAKRVWPGPIVENAWRRLRLEYGKLKASLPSQMSVPSAEGWRTMAKMLQVARAGAAELDRLAALPWQEKRRIEEHYRRDSANAAMQAQAAHGVAPAAAFDPAGLVQRLAGEGVYLAADGGNIRASGRRALTPAELDYISLHKAAVVSFLARVQTI
jgi:IS5 family transposase